MRSSRQSRGCHPPSSGQIENPQLPTAALSGATLSEILISLMVMSIGVVSLATLFPISVLRSIQATQLTNATIHRINAEQLIQLFPRLVHDPDNDKLANPTNYLSEHNSERFIVDPLGWNNGILSGVQSVFGNSGGTPVAQQPIARYSGGFGNMTDAMRTAYLGDTWQLAAKGMVTGYTTNSVDIPVGIDLATAQQSLSSSSATNPILVRVILLSADGKQSQTRPLTTAAMIDPTGPPPQINWSTLTPAQPLPTGFVPARFRLEIYDPRYSWILSVRKTPNPLLPAGDAQVEVVVFHRRPFSVASEQVFNLLNDLNVGETQFTLDLTSTNALNIKPFLKKGSFVFDAENAHWYRVVQVQEHAVNPVVTIDRPAKGAIHAGLAAPNNGPDIIAMPGVVEVYPIGTISYDTNNTP